MGGRRKGLNIDGLRILDSVAFGLESELESYKGKGSLSQRQDKEIVTRSLAAIESGSKLLKEAGVDDDTAEFETKYRVYQCLTRRFGDTPGFDLGFRAAKISRFKNPPVPPLPPDGKPGTNPIAVERRRMIDNYIAEVKKMTGRKISRKDIYTDAGYDDRREFERWQSGNAKTNSAVDTAIRRALRTKRHLNPKP